MVRNKVSISDFRFIFLGKGAYNVIYTSPITGKMWKIRITDMPLIDLTKNSDSPKRKDLEALKAICKR